MPGHAAVITYDLGKAGRHGTCCVRPAVVHRQKGGMMMTGYISHDRDDAHDVSCTATWQVPDSCWFNLLGWVLQRAVADCDADNTTRWLHAVMVQAGARGMRDRRRVHSILSE